MHRSSLQSFTYHYICTFNRYAVRKWQKKKKHLDAFLLSQAGFFLSAVTLIEVLLHEKDSSSGWNTTLFLLKVAYITGILERRQSWQPRVGHPGTMRQAGSRQASRRAAPLWHSYSRFSWRRGARTHTNEAARSPGSAYAGGQERIKRYQRAHHLMETHLCSNTHGQSLTERFELATTTDATTTAAGSAVSCKTCRRTNLFFFFFLRFNGWCKSRNALPTAHDYFIKQETLKNLKRWLINRHHRYNNRANADILVLVCRDKVWSALVVLTLIELQLGGAPQPSPWHCPDTAKAKGCRATSPERFCRQHQSDVILFHVTSDGSIILLRD